MENGWERTLPLVKINEEIIADLFRDVVNYSDILDVSLLDGGCRTTNYMVESKKHNKYVLKIFYENDKSYKKDIALFDIVKKYVPVQEICKIDYDKFINKEYIIYRYIDGKTISQHVKEGNKITERMVRSVAGVLGRIHNIKFKKVGSLDDNLNIKSQLEPMIELYDKYINENVKLRLGTENITKIKQIVYKYKDVLLSLECDSRLIHGDFQGTNIIVNNDSVASIIDWEFCMSGCPLVDIGQFFRYESYFDSELIRTFENEYRNVCNYELMDNWYDISKIIDLLSLIRLISGDKEMPNKYSQIKEIVECSIKRLY